VAEPFVKRYDHDVHLSAEHFYVGNHVIQSLGIGEGVYIRWSSRRCMVEFVMRENVNIGAPGAFRSSPRFSRADTVVAQEAQPQAATFDEGGPPSVR
jgi:hypothetical protein